MSEQRFEVFQECEYLEEWSSCPYCIKYDGETVFETLPLGIAKEVCKKLNEQQATITELKEENEKLQKDLYIVQTDCKNAKESKEHWRNKARELEEKNKQIGFLKRDLYTIIRDTKETPFGNSITMTKIRERWE